MTLWKLNDMFATRPQVAANDFFNAFKSGDFSFLPDAAHGFMDKWHQNFQYLLGPANPAFIDATLSYEDMDWGYRLEYNPNGVLWRISAAGIPNPDDYDRYLEQQRVIESATDKTLTEVEPLANASQVAEDSSLPLTVKGFSVERREQVSNHPRIINPYAGGDGESKVGESNRNKAIEYALKYANNTSDHDGFHFFGATPGSGSDCANFVSQCLFAGGIPMSEGWNWKGISYEGWRGVAKDVGIDHPAVLTTPSWVQPDALYRYFSQPGRCYGVSYITSVDDIPRVAAYIKPGDIIAFNNLGEDNPKGYINHVAIVTEVKNGEIYYSGHTDARNNDPLSVILTRQNYQGDLYFIHVNYDQ
jgi:cell wall-associated NlpC family hydrolase